MEYLSANFELKTVDLPQRIISGYACVHNTVDRVHDVIDPIASAKAVARLGSPADIAVFVGHDTKSLPVGIPRKIEATEQGLFVETYILRGSAGDNLLAEAKDLMDHGQSLDMSIGYRALQSTPERAGTKTVRRLLDYDLREYSFAAAQAIANPMALVSAVKTATPTAAIGDSTLPSTRGSTQSAEASLGGGAWGHKTHPDGDTARAARREQARAELERCEREAEIERAERALRQARLAELRAQNDELGRYVLDQQRRQVDEQIREREEREKRQKELMQRLREVATMPILRTRRDCEEALDELDRYLDREAQAEQDRLWRETDAALTRRTYDWPFRRSWDARHPGGPDRCQCDGCRAWRREPPR
jgi:HK97 family phage prohead protease